jgi:hypothetical protein
VPIVAYVGPPLKPLDSKLTNEIPMKHYPIHIDDIIRLMLDIFPDMQVDEDLDGQLIVYTGTKCISSDGFYGPVDDLAGT